jgi:hypothetical protein
MPAQAGQAQQKKLTPVQLARKRQLAAKRRPAQLARAQAQQKRAFNRANRAQAQQKNALNRANRVAQRNSRSTTPTQAARRR